MDKNDNNKYDVDIPDEIIASFARFLVPELRRFYESEEGQVCYKEWLAQHPEDA